MWISNGLEVWNDEDGRYTCKEKYGRNFLVDKIYRCDILGRRTNQVDRYDIVERWTSKEQPEMCGRGFYLRGDRSVTVLSFNTSKDVDTFLSLLVWVLNAPPSIPLEEIISPTLLKMVNNHVTTEKPCELTVENCFQDKLDKQLYGTHVYAFALSNDTVKIGISNNPVGRAAAVISHSGLEILSFCYTKRFERRKALAIETECHNYFAPYRTKGEFFKISYEMARDKLQTYGKIFEKAL